MRLIVKFLFPFSLLVPFIASCDSKFPAGANDDQQENAPVESGGFNRAVSRVADAHQQEVARENDQLLDKALDDPDQKKRADLALRVHLRPSYEKCVKRAEAETPALLDCNAEEFHYQDSRLNRLYRERMVALDKSHQQILRDKQREWIKSRDALCNLKGVLGGGQAEVLEQSSCQLNATAKRADELELAD